MLKFDRLKIVTSVEYISNIDTNIFLTQSKGNTTLYYKYLQEKPFYLLVQADINKQELVVEFTGKILLNDYPLLINSATIQKCFDSINKMGICHLDTEKIINEGEVWKCDIAQDTKSTFIQEIVQQTKQSISNYDKWNCDKYEGNGIAIYNTAKTKRYKKRLIIYDKQKELSKATNRDFFNQLNAPIAICDYYKDKIRFELNIITKEQIRKLLDISDNTILSVMNSKANPILAVYEEATCPNKEEIHFTDKKDYFCHLVLRDCNYDLEAVEMKMRALTPKNTSIKRTMQPFREYYAKIRNSNVYDYVRSLLI